MSDKYEQEVLAHVRAMRQGVVMRELSPRHPLFGNGRCAVLDICTNDHKTPGYSKVLYQGETWEIVLEKMRRVGT